MLKRLFPSIYVNSIYDIKFEELYNEGYRGIIFDIDNTLVSYDTKHPDERIVTLMEMLKGVGFNVALVSNNNRIRVQTFNEKLQLKAYHKALKPMTRKIKIAMQAISTDRSNTILVGDQIFTDIYGGNRLGLKTILVIPISEKEEWITKIKRNTEKKIIKAYLKRVNKNAAKH
ncbi:YqeG family HAD IIIA-type phosphatase [Vallitalea pronyensis]|uniref:YqeG family HAD IIIA-type phosphatase n=1 Tax=Vallitalea pronyensis TaxID=1348613 RepID=A0A8J8MLD2_9FIRM|nr:YqeG family HAD IIIA-type phosphatase [Vallitalea pronyensis]QUI23820.1 YqeG family HAD IIIA-type phosphatase [Vallitalea pronyensis]